VVAALDVVGIGAAESVTGAVVVAGAVDVAGAVLVVGAGGAGGRDCSIW